VELSLIHFSRDCQGLAREEEKAKAFSLIFNENLMQSTTETSLLLVFDEA
jgi:hypothetical protein